MQLRKPTYTRSKPLRGMERKVRAGGDNWLQEVTPTDVLQCMRAMRCICLCTCIVCTRRDRLNSSTHRPRHGACRRRAWRARARRRCPSHSTSAAARCQSTRPQPRTTTPPCRRCARCSPASETRGGAARPRVWRRWEVFFDVHTSGCSAATWRCTARELVVRKSRRSSRPSSASATARSTPRCLSASAGARGGCGDWATGQVVKRRICSPCRHTGRAAPRPARVDRRAQAGSTMWSSAIVSTLKWAS